MRQNSCYLKFMTIDEILFLVAVHGNEKLGYKVLKNSRMKILKNLIGLSQMKRHLKKE